MTVADIPRVTEIERESFPTTWPQSSYKRELQENGMARYLVVGDRTAPPPDRLTDAPGSHGMGKVIGGVRRLLGRDAAGLPPPTEDQLVAFLGLWFMLEECHVVTVAVREAMRRRGIGELLVITAIELALQKEQDVLTLECRVSNTAAQALYEKYGFKSVGVRKRYYTDNGENAFIMTTPPIHTPEFRSAFERLRSVHGEHWGAAEIAVPELP